MATPLSIKIRREAKQLRRKDKTIKLTEHQNKIARSLGYKSYKAILIKEKQANLQERISSAKGKNEINKGIFLYQNRNVKTIIRKDGLRALVARRNLSKGETILEDKAYLYISFNELKNVEEGFPWALTEQILTRFPHCVSDMVENGLFRESFKPKLDKQDKEILSRLSQELSLPKSYINKVYNLVCTYNIKSGLHLIDDVNKQVIIAERMSIPRGLAYANHSCQPNSIRIPALTVEDFKKMTDGLIASEDIVEGEEITWSYLHDIGNKGFKQRQKSLKQSFGFNCSCQKCFQDKVKKTR